MATLVHDGSALNDIAMQVERARVDLVEWAAKPRFTGMGGDVVVFTY